MRFGLWYDFRNPVSSGRRLSELYAETLDQIALAEQLGYDDIWMSEHHFAEDGYLPSQLPMAAAIAGRTDRVRIGTSVTLMPFHHPVRLAEDFAVVDNLSDGRMVFGPAVGYIPGEFAAFGVPRRHRGSITEEAIQVMRLCWEEERFSFHGRHFQFDDVRCTPKPAQQSIPIWVGAVAGEAVRRAARLGDGFLRGGDGSNHQDYLTALDELGRTPQGGPRVATAGVHLFVSEDPERDWRSVGPHGLYQARLYAKWMADAGQPLFGRPPRDLDELRARGSWLVGTPETVAHSIRSLYERAPFDRFMFFAIWPGLPVEDATRSVALFADRVMPLLRELPEPGGGRWSDRD